MKKKIRFTIKADPLARNELHFEVQKNTRAHVFVDRKKRAKAGYKKHKNQED